MLIPDFTPVLPVCDDEALAGTFDVFDKLDGHRLMCRAGCFYRRRRTHNEFSMLPDAVRRSLDSVGPQWLDGELVIDGGTAADVSSALAGGTLFGGGQLRFRPFHVVGWPGDPRSECAELRRMGFDPPRYLGRFSGGQVADRWPAWSKSCAEGVVLRPVSGGPWRKLKRTETEDLTVVGLKPGRGRLDGLLGALVCHTPGGIAVTVGAGWSDEDRAAIGPQVIGRKLEVRFQARTPRGSLQHARFVRWRDDLYPGLIVAGASC